MGQLRVFRIKNFSAQDDPLQLFLDSKNSNPSLILPLSPLQMFNFQFGPKYSQLYQQSSSTMSYAINQLRSQHEAFSSTAPYAYQE